LAKLPYLQAFVDRLGVERYYFRRPPFRFPLPGKPGSPEFNRAYEEAKAKAAPHAPPVRDKIVAGSFRALAILYFSSGSYRGLPSPTTRQNYRRVIDEFCRQHGHRRVDQFAREHIEIIMGAMADRPGAAFVLLKRLRTLIKFAIALRWIAADPTAGVRLPKLGEHHTWDEAEIAAFESFWPVGTSERLAFDLLLTTAQRVSDAAAMTVPVGDVFAFTQRKTGRAMLLPVYPALRRSLQAMGRKPGEHINLNAYGVPFTEKGFAMFVGNAIRKAGLPDHCVAHGLRKAAARRAAEDSASANEIMALTGHATLAEAERYTRAASQLSLAQSAMKKRLAREGVSNPDVPGVKLPRIPPEMSGVALPTGIEPVFSP
jgi:integrase